MSTSTSNLSPADKAAVAAALVFPTLATWFYFLAMNGAPAGWQQAAAGLGKTIQFAFPLIWVLAIQRRRRGPQAAAFQGSRHTPCAALDGTRRVPATRGLALGAGFGLLVFAVALAVYGGWLKPSGFLDEAGRRMADKVTGFGVRSWPWFAAMGVFYALLHSLLEEYYWRWFVFGQLRRWIPVGAAIAVSSLAFTAHHVLVLGFYFGGFSLPTGILALAVAIGGVFWAWLYQRGGSLYGPWLSHAMIDAALFLIGYDLIRPVLH
jgi:membrane protease YdiL (CAAX protease family)